MSAGDLSVPVEEQCGRQRVDTSETLRHILISNYDRVVDAPLSDVRLHGPHQVAQKLTSTTLPRYSESFNSEP